MKQDLSRYFSKNPLERWPLYQLLLLVLAVVALAGALGAAVGAADRPAAQPLPEAAPVMAEPPAPTATPQPGNQPKVVLYLSASAARQSVGVELYTLETTHDGEESEWHSTTRVPVTDVPFEIEVRGPDGKRQELQLDPAQGTLLLEDLEPGEYTVAVKNAEGYSMPQPQTVTVTERTEYAADVEAVQQKLTSGAAVDAAREDPYNVLALPFGDAIADTVAYAEPQSVEVQPEGPAQPTMEGEYLCLNDGTVTPYRPVYDEGGALTAARRDPQPTPAAGQATAEQATTAFDGWPQEIAVAQWPEYGFALSAATPAQLEYVGWQTVEDATYYYDPETHRPVTGRQVIAGQVYQFDETGALQPLRRGVEVSQQQGAVNWSAVAADGVEYAVLRCGYRGAESGALVQDSRFAENLAAARAAGLAVGVSFCGQAVDEAEAVEEAAAVLALLNGEMPELPVFYEVRSCQSGRTASLTASQRTACVAAFCETIAAAGCTPAVYSYAGSFYNALNYSNLSKYQAGLMQYRCPTDFRYPCAYWQYTAAGQVAGVSGPVRLSLAE